jgi:kinesin family protein 13
MNSSSSNPDSDSKVKVAVRVRPFNRREVELGTQCIVEVNGQQIILQNPSLSSGSTQTSSTGNTSFSQSSSSKNNVDTSSNSNNNNSLQRRNCKQFTFDHCFWSFNESDGHFANQEQVYRELGLPVLESSFQGYNACIFAYGQTGSGKSYTMMGSSNNMGLIPRLCDGLFERIDQLNKDPNTSFKVEVSYMEIYNEKVHDLLDPKGVKQNLRVREHNILGPYVDGLSKLAVSSYHQIDNLMTEGNKSRTVAATNMNSESSRSHAVFTIILTCSLFDSEAGVTGEKVSKMSLVDLAGSERAVKTGAVGDRLKEGSNINKSLTTLGLVISKLADSSPGKGKESFVPYRDSVLTWLLKDNLGGNSKTVMVATVSPAADNFDESLSTLRYADRAKRIVNHAIVNEDPNARMIRELKEEVEMLREQLKDATQSVQLRERLTESEKLISEMTQTWEERLRQTELIHQERQKQLEKMGISVESSGIKVETNKYYLVNLNSDPAMNELLVYYLKDKTLVGRAEASVEQDIQLSGIGIQDEHAVIEIDTIENNVYMIPLEGAKTCVNGSVIREKTILSHGDRILWGNNHFFKVSCPKRPTSNQGYTSFREVSSAVSSPVPPPIYSPSGDGEDEYSSIDFNFAQEELMMKELSNDPIQSAWKNLEKQHEDDKTKALEKQKEMYEKQLQLLRNQISPTAPYATPLSPGSSMTGLMQSVDSLGSTTRLNAFGIAQSKMDNWAKERDELFKKSLATLKEDIIKANSLVLEANAFAQEMNRNTEFKVTLQIPASNLSPNRRKGAFVSEPAILVKRKNKASQIWSMEKMENKLIDMRELYEEWKNQGSPSNSIVNVKHDPFFESQETHHLIGVGSIFLEVLFHDVTLDYHVPIISQQGEVAGRLQVEVSRIGGQMGERMADAGNDDQESSTNTDDTSRTSSPDVFTSRNQVAVRVRIKTVRGLPVALSNYVFCQYTFWGCNDAVVAPAKSNHERTHPDEENGVSVLNFDHNKEFVVTLSEEFLEYCTEGALAIEVWGHRSVGFSSPRHSGWEVLAETQIAEVNRSLSDRWAELKRKIELWIEIQELNDNGEYAAVEVAPREGNLTGGVYQLRQGQQRRILVRVNPYPGDTGTLPLICESISSVAVGGVSVRSRILNELDSYQDQDLRTLKEKWKDALDRRRIYLRDQMLQLDSKVGKTEEDEDRGKRLMEQWVNLLEEEKVLDDPHSDIPGADPADPPSKGMEAHVPVVFLDMTTDDMSSVRDSLIAGLNLILPKEHNATFFNLPIVKYNEKDVSVVAAWDSSIHDSPALNRVSSAEERISLIVRVAVRLSHPAVVDVILRKRISINVFKRQSITDRIKKSITRSNTLTATGVVYEIVSSIPKESEDIEDRESLALVAASGIEGVTLDGESYIEKYTKGVSAVEGILALDKLRQEVAVKELLQNGGGSSIDASMRKTTSISNVGFLLANSSGSMTKLDYRAAFGSSFDISELLAKAGNLFVSNPTTSLSPNIAYTVVSDEVTPNGSSNAGHEGTNGSRSVGVGESSLASKCRVF